MVISRCKYPAGDCRLAKRTKELEAENARLRAAVSALLPIAEQLQTACANGDTVDYGNHHDAEAGETFANVIILARAALTPSQEAPDGTV